MQSGTMVFTQMNRVIFGQPAAATIVAEAERLAAKRVFLLTGRTLNRNTEEVEKVRQALGSRFAGVHDHMPARAAIGVADLGPGVKLELCATAAVGLTKDR